MKEGKNEGRKFLIKLKLNSRKGGREAQKKC